MFFSALLIGFVLGVAAAVLTIDSALTSITYAATEEVTETKPFPAVLKEIARCESKGRQFEDDGSVVRGEIDPRDTGKYQINTFYWADTAKALGFDIYTEAGNEQMAAWLLEHEGTDPWNASAHCWRA
ncbi:hypothetical protein [Dongia sp.]|uniref:hypothetical protein n=1 Tax=Dongia sp. TaxID=1977262 RepID=UPI00374FF01D